MDTKGLVIWTTVLLNLSRNIVALQVETLCYAYYHVCDQLVSQQNAMLQVEATCCTKKTRVLLSATNFSFAARITTEASTCLATNLNFNACDWLSRSPATPQIEKKKHGGS